MISAQDKILHVANKLGLSTLKDMQASTGAIYDADIDGSGVIFGNASQHGFPGATNLTQNRFEVNEALLIETVSFYVCNISSPTIFANQNFQEQYGSNAVIVFDVIIGNKRVLKDMPVFGAGNTYAFASPGLNSKTDFATNKISELYLKPRHQVYMEGAGILIPPQVDFSIEYRLFDIVTGALIPITSTQKIAAYIYGTKVLLNFNTSI